MAKLHWNSCIFTPDRRYLVVDVKNFYLNNPMNKAEYYNIAMKLILQLIIDKYYLNTKKIDEYIYLIVKNGMYVMVQAGIIAHTSLK